MDGAFFVRGREALPQLHEGNPAMKRLILAAMVLWTIIAIPARSEADLITYQLNNYPAYQNGWLLSGYITTDGTIGTITAADIVSWQWTVTQGATSLNFNSSDTGPYGEYAYAGVENVVATPDFLQLSTTFLPSSARNDLTLLDPLGAPPGMENSLAWEWTQATPSPLFTLIGNDPSIPGQAPDTSASLFGYSWTPDSPLTIATVQPVPRLMRSRG
jgi:hypothetical protein